MSVLNSGILSNPLQSSPNCRQSPIHRPTARIPRALAISTTPGASDNPYDSENSENTTENPTLPTAKIPSDSENPFRQRESHRESHAPLRQRESLATARIPSDSDNPKRQRQSLRQREQREYHGESHPYDSENTFRYREYLPTARIPSDSDNPYDSENTTENLTLTTARIPSDSDNPYNP